MFSVNVPFRLKYKAMRGSPLAEKLFSGRFRLGLPLVIDLCGMMMQLIELRGLWHNVALLLLLSSLGSLISQVIASSCYAQTGVTSSTTLDIDLHSKQALRGIPPGWARNEVL